MKKYSLFFLAVFLFLSFSGCNTCKGAMDGFKKDWNGLKKTDDWIQKNLW